MHHYVCVNCNASPAKSRDCRSGSLASLFWLRTHWDTYKNDPIAFANGVPRVGEGSELNSIQHTSDIFTSLIDAFKFFPSFLLLGFVGYAVNRWRGFQVWARSLSAAAARGCTVCAHR